MVLINYTVDPFGVFNSNFLPLSGGTNQRFAKIEHLLKNKKKHNSYIFGSSIASFINPENLEKHIPNSNFYNLSFNSGTIYEYSITLYTMLKEGLPVTNVLLLLDVQYMTFKHLKTYDKPPYKSSQEFRLHPSLLTNISKWRYYFDYIKQFHVPAIRTKLKNNINRNFNLDIVNNGMQSWMSAERMLSDNPEEYINEHVEFNNNANKRNVRIMGPEITREIVDFKNFCKANNINLTIIINPTNYNRLNMLVTKKYLSFLFNLSQETDYWNFSGYNSIAMNNRNFYDLNHFRPYVADLMIGKIFNDYNGPDDFGTFVTRNNINDHINNLQSQFNKADLELQAKRKQLDGNKR